MRQDELHEKMILECQENLQISEEEAEERVEQYFAELQYFLSVEYAVDDRENWLRFICNF